MYNARVQPQAALGVRNFPKKYPVGTFFWCKTPKKTEELTDLGGKGVNQGGFFRGAWQRIGVIEKIALTFGEWTGTQTEAYSFREGGSFGLEGSAPLSRRVLGYFPTSAVHPSGKVAAFAWKALVGRL